MDKPTPQEIENQINDFIAQHSRFEARRDYLSISHVGNCPRKVVEEFRNGFQVAEHTHRMAFAGYEMEDSIRRMLEALGLVAAGSEGLEVVSPWDKRLRGHLDGLTPDGDVLEFKSVSRGQFSKILEKGRPLWRHFVQVQLYMRYGELRNALVVYRCRENYEHRVLEVPYNERQAATFEVRAGRMLEAIDQGKTLECECGMCGQKLIHHTRPSAETRWKSQEET